ncbi:MAG: chlorophyll a/b-binding protein [Cyanobium sp.]
MAAPSPAESAGPSNDASASPATTSATTPDVPAFGWSAYAERVNGRFAMVGFVAVLLVEAISGDTFLRWAGLLP